MLMQRHKAMLLRYVRRYVRDADDALDVVQESFLAAWRAIGRYDEGRSRFDVWLRRIALNRCRDRARWMALRGLFVRDAEAAAYAPDPGPDGEMQTITRQRLSALDQALQDLPPTLKDALVLTALEGLSQREAGEILGVSAKAVELRAHRARLRLAAALGHR